MKKLLVVLMVIANITCLGQVEGMNNDSIFVNHLAKPTKKVQKFCYRFSNVKLDESVDIKSPLLNVLLEYINYCAEDSVIVGYRFYTYIGENCSSYYDVYTDTNHSLFKHTKGNATEYYLSKPNKCVKEVSIKEPLNNPSLENFTKWLEEIYSKGEMK